MTPTEAHLAAVQAWHTALTNHITASEAMRKAEAELTTAKVNMDKAFADVRRESGAPPERSLSISQKYGARHNGITLDEALAKYSDTGELT